MTWQLFLGLSIFAEVSGRLIQRVLLRDDKSDPIAYTIVFQLLGGTVIGIYAFITGFTLPNLQPVLLNLVLVPILFGSANIFIFKSLQLTEASIFTVLFASRSLWLILGAILLLSEKFSTQQFMGAVLIITSVIIISWKRQQIRLQKGELFAILAAFLLACSILNDAYIVKAFNVPSYLTLQYLITSIFLWIVYHRKTKKIISLVQSKTIHKIALLAIAYGTASITYLSAYKLGNNAAQLGTIFQISSILTVLLAIIILKEKSSIPIKIVAAILSFIGVLLVK